MDKSERVSLGGGRRWGWLVLFTSSSTLICCALPIFLVTLGLGAVSATLFETLPFLVTLAKHKLWMFVGSAAMLALGGWALYRPGATVRLIRCWPSNAKRRIAGTRVFGGRRL
jgi:hypothetical protein